MNRLVTAPSFVHVHAVVAAAILLSFAVPVHAQFDSAQVSGVAQDTTGAVLPGVDVTLLNDGDRSGTADGDQRNRLYTFPNVPVGTYTVSAGCRDSRDSRGPA